MRESFGRNLISGQREQRRETKKEIQETAQKGRCGKVAQINHKAVRSLSKLIEAGFDSEKAVLNMTMDDILSLSGITVAEIGMINEIQKAVKAGKGHYVFRRRRDMSSRKNNQLYRQPRKPALFSARQFFSASGVWKRGLRLRFLPLSQ